MNHSFMKIVNSLKFKMCESFNFINTLLLWWIGCPPPIREYTVTCPSKEELEITAGFRGHHFTSKHHWLLVGSSYTTWEKKSDSKARVILKNLLHKLLSDHRAYTNIMC